MASSKAPRRTASLISSTLTDHSYHFPVWVPYAAVGLAGLAEIFAGAIVGPAHQVNLGQRVEDGAGGDVELHRLADFERPHQDVFGAIQIADLHEHLPQGRERDRQAVAFPQGAIEGDAALGEGQRLVEPVRHQRQDGLVVCGAGQDVVGVDGRGEPFRQPQRRGGFLDAPFLPLEHARQPVHERQVALVAGGVQRVGGLGEMLADDGGVAHPLVAHGQFVVGQANQPRIVRQFREFEGARVQGDRPRLLAALEREASVQAPQRGEPGIRKRLFRNVGRPSQCRGGLREVVLQQVGLGDPRPDRELVVAGERTRPVVGQQDLDRFGAPAAFEGRSRSGQCGLDRGSGHGRSIQNARDYNPWEWV